MSSATLLLVLRHQPVSCQALFSAICSWRNGGVMTGVVRNLTLALDTRTEYVETVQKKKRRI